MKKHFTLTELLVTIAIIAILAGMGVGIFSLVKQQSAYADTETVVAKISAALKNTREKRGLPDYSGMLVVDNIALLPFCGSKKTTAIFLDACGGEQELKKYTVEINGQKVLCDAWEKPLVYIAPGHKNTRGFDLVSAGADGEIDGVAVLADDGSFNTAVLAKVADTLENDDIVNY